MPMILINLIWFIPTNFHAFSSMCSAASLGILKGSPFGEVALFLE